MPNFELRPRAGVTLALVLLPYLLVMLTLVIYPGIAVWGRLVLLLVVAGVFVLSWKSAYCHIVHPSFYVSFSSEGWCWGDGKDVKTAQLCSSSVNWQWLVVLRFRVGDELGIRSLPLVAASLHPDVYRQLQCCWRLGVLQPGDNTVSSATSIVSGKSSV